MQWTREQISGCCGCVSGAEAGVFGFMQEKRCWPNFVVSDAIMMPMIVANKWSSFLVPVLEWSPACIEMVHSQSGELFSRLLACCRMPKTECQQIRYAKKTDGLIPTSSLYVQRFSEGILHLLLFLLLGFLLLGFFLGLLLCFA
jgi:hypothetical protein